MRGAVFRTSFKASTLHVNREPGCGVTEFLSTEVWFPDKENETLSPSPYESNMHANFFFKLYLRLTLNNPILFQRKKRVKLMLHACKAF